jgi:hypothetical protein
LIVALGVLGVGLETPGEVGEPEVGVVGVVGLDVDPLESLPPPPQPLSMSAAVAIATMPKKARSPDLLDLILVPLSPAHASHEAARAWISKGKADER